MPREEVKLRVQKQVQSDRIRTESVVRAECLHALLCRILQAVRVEGTPIRSGEGDPIRKEGSDPIRMGDPIR